MKIGDKVRCVDNYVTDKKITMHTLTLGREYTVLDINDEFITIENDNKRRAEYFSRRFEPINNEEVTSMNDEFIVGGEAICTDSGSLSDEISQHKVYDILQVSENSIRIINDKGESEIYAKSRFTPGSTSKVACDSSIDPKHVIKTYDNQTAVDIKDLAILDSEDNMAVKIEKDGSIDPKWFVDNREPILSTTIEDMQGCANVADAITEDVQVIDFEPVVNVLGTDYSIEIVDPDLDEYLEGIHGYCDFLTKSIVLRKVRPTDYQGNIDALNAQYKVNLRHELMHAFLYESGLDSSTVDGWARNEEMIDFMALQLPKIAKVMQDCKIL